MTLTLRTLIGAAWALARRERELVLAIAGLLVFLPALAVQLFVPAPPPLPDTGDAAAMQTWFDAIGVWGQPNAWWHIASRSVALVGLAAIVALCVDRDRPDTRGAITLSLALFLRIALAMVLVAIPVGFGMWLLLLPGLYVQARLIAVLPVLIAERPTAAVAALARSMRLTRTSQFGLFGATTTLFLAQLLAITPLLSLDRWLRMPGHDNAAVTLAVDALLAIVTSGYQVAMVLVGIVAYRRLAAASKGV